MSESDVYRRHNLTFEIDPRTVRVNPLTTGPDYIHFYILY